jgi:acyl-CoA synthetase (AMP-forming)/AMP-acid ligase II
MGFVPDLSYQPTIPVVLRRAVEMFGDDDFVVMPDRRISFREAEAASRHLAKQLLAAGVGKGTRVGIHVPTGTEWAVFWLAVTRIGALAMPFSTLYRPAELRAVLRLGDVAILLSQPMILGKDHETYLEEAVPGLSSCSSGHLRIAEVPYLRSIWLLGESARNWAQNFAVSSGAISHSIDGFDDELLEAHEAEVTPADDLHVTFTSGSSASPKAVVHTHGAVLRKTAPVANAGLDTTFPGRALSLMPFFWVGGIQMVAGALQSGAAVLTLEKIEPSAAIELGRREGATSVLGNPAAMRSMMGSASLDEQVLPTLRALPKRPWDDAPPSSRGEPATPLGMTETLGAWARVDGFQYRVVDPETGKEVSEGEEGEFLVRGYGVMSGFYKRERAETFTDDGFYPTGDLGYIENGAVYFKARRSDMIKTKGANVAPAEVEAVLNALPDVRISFVVGLPHPLYGEQVVAAVLPEDGESVDVDALRAHARRVLSSYKVPRVVEVISEDDITWLPSGKPSKRGVADLLVQRATELHDPTASGSLPHHDNDQ